MRLDSDEVDAFAQQRVGTTIKGKWKLDRLIGVGGMAAVYAATHRNRKKAALKILHREYSEKESIRKRFQREGYVANTVGHTGVVKVDDDDMTEDGCAFLVMELIEGETLDERLTREGPLPAAEVLGYMDQVLDTVATAHAKGIIHRDLKPENMLLGGDGTVKLLDFGIARVRELTTDPTRTLTEGLLGTPAFMPPEQARGNWGEVDARSDLWSLGATMFTLLTGCYVHDAETAHEVLAEAMAEQAPPLKQLRPDMPEGICSVVDRALEYDKNARFPTATMMLVAVRKAIAELSELPVAAQREQAWTRSARASEPEIEVFDPTLEPRPAAGAGERGRAADQHQDTELDSDAAANVQAHASAKGAADKLRMAAAALEVFEQQRKQDEELAEDAETQVHASQDTGATTAEVVPEAQPHVPPAETEADFREPEPYSVIPPVGQASEAEADFREPEPYSDTPRERHPSDEELTVVRANPLTGQAEDQSALPVINETPAPARAETESDFLQQPAAPPPGQPEHADGSPAPAGGNAPNEAVGNGPTGLETPAAAGGTPHGDAVTASESGTTESGTTTEPALATPAAAAAPSDTAAPAAIAAAAGTAAPAHVSDTLTPATAPAVGASAPAASTTHAENRTPAPASAPDMRTSGDAAAAEPSLPPPRSQMATERSLKRRQAAQSTAWSIAATLIGVAAVVVLVTWLVGKRQAAPLPEPGSSRLEAAQVSADTPSFASAKEAAEPAETTEPAEITETTEPAEPADSAAPPSAPSEPSAEAETVDLEELPVLPSRKIDVEKYRVEQAKQVAKRELADEAARSSAPAPSASSQ